MRTKKPNTNTKNLAAMVRQYLREYAPVLDEKLACYRGMSSLKEVVYTAACSLDACGKIEGHQRRVGRAVLGRAAWRLLRHLNGLQECASFADLIDCIERHTEHVERLDRLATYDTAVRIGAYLNLWPEAVYPHAGVGQGCRALGLKTGRQPIPMSEFPAPIAALKPYQAENFLCIYSMSLDMA